MELRRESGVPLYQQIKNAIRAEIESGHWLPGERVPSEPELSQRLGVARGTVRNAITELVHEGWLERRQGDGTYVARPRLEQRLMGFYSFAREARERGQEILSQVLAWETVPCSEGLGKRLGRAADTPVLCVTRLRSLEGEPILLETCFFPEEVVRGLRREDFERGALYDALEERCGVRVARAEEAFGAVALGGREAELLRVPVGSPALSVERLAYAVGGQPVEWRLSTLRGDRCRYRIELR